jgi:hypothetical protein
MRVGLVRGALVAGRAPAPLLLALARRPLRTLRSAAQLHVPRVARWFPRPVELTLGGSRRRLTVSAFSALRPRP